MHNGSSWRVEPVYNLDHFKVLRVLKIIEERFALISAMPIPLFEVSTKRGKVYSVLNIDDIFDSYSRIKQDIKKLSITYTDDLYTPEVLYKIEFDKDESMINAWIHAEVAKNCFELSDDIHEQIKRW